MAFKKLLLPVTVPLLLSSFNILNNTSTSASLYSAKVLSVWAVSACYLFLLWVANSYLLQKKYFVGFAKAPVLKIVMAVLYNMLLVLTLAVVAKVILGNTTNILGQHLPRWAIFIKLSIACALIICIQYALVSLQQTQAYKLANAQLQNENLEARLQSLKQQINPHFLFNALSTLRTMVRANDNNAEKFIINLSELYRQLLHKRDLATITLGEEIEFLVSYVFMLQARFENTLLVNITILPESTKKQIPAFSLQLLVENCIKHNIISSARPLCIDVYQNDVGSVTVQNNLQTKPSFTEESQGIGLNNLMKRYELLHVEEGVLVRSDAAKFTVTVKLLP